MNKIEEEDIEVTKIKICIRTLLRSSNERRRRLIDLAVSRYGKGEKRGQVREVMESDLGSKGFELGYDIPRIPKEAYLEDLMKSGQIKTPKTVTRIANWTLAKKINSKELTFSKFEFESSIANEFKALLLKTKSQGNKEEGATLRVIEEGIKRSYLLLGLREELTRKVLDMNEASTLDLSKSKPVE